MVMLRIALVAGFSLAFAVSAAAQSAAPRPRLTTHPAARGIIDRVIASQEKSDDALEVYERLERVESRKDPNDLAPSSVKVSRVVPSGTGYDRIPIGPDGVPPDAAAYRQNLEKLEKALALVVDDSRSQHDSLEKYAKKRKEGRDLIAATRDAFLFQFLGHETRGTRTLSKYSMDPNPDFRPTSRFTSIFPKVHGFLWVDDASGELARIEADVTGDVSIGLFLAKVYKGSHFMLERYEFLPGLWFASFSQYDFDGRKLFSGFSIHERTFYSNYRYIGPPKEALAIIRAELGRGESGKPAWSVADP